MPYDDQQPLAQAIGLACYGEEPRCERLNQSGNAVFRMVFRDGARVLKVAAGTIDPKIGKEAAALAALAASEVPVPKLEHADAQGARLGRPFFITTDEGADTVGSLCQASPEAGAAWAERMGEVLARVHGIELGAHPGLVEVLEHAEIGRFWPQVRQAAKAFAEAGVFDSRDVERFLAHAPPDAAGEALCHADFSGKQCVVSEGRIAAVVDWAAAWIGDPSIDLAIAASHWDLAGVTGASEAMLAGYRRVSPLPERYESIERAARMAFLVHVVGLWHEQGASSWRAAQLGGKLDRARALFADYAQRLD